MSGEVNNMPQPAGVNNRGEPAVHDALSCWLFQRTLDAHALHVEWLPSVWLTRTGFHQATAATTAAAAAQPCVASGDGEGCEQQQLPDEPASLAQQLGTLQQQEALQAVWQQVGHSSQAPLPLSDQLHLCLTSSCSIMTASSTATHWYCAAANS
jgi:hypothetical protein